MSDESSEKSGRRIDQVVDRAAEGATDRQIAEALGVSFHTVGTYWKRLRTQYGVSTRTAVVLAHLKQRLQAQEQALTAELARRTEAEEKLRAANDELRALHEATEKGLADRLSTVQKLAVRAEHAERTRLFLDRATRGAKAVAYEVESIAPVIYRGFSPSVELFPLDAERLMSGEKTFYDLVHPEDLQAMQLQMVGIDFKAGHRYSYLYRMLFPEPRWILDTHAPSFDEQGNLQTVIGIALDVHHLIEKGIMEGRFSITVTPHP